MLTTYNKFYFYLSQKPYFLQVLIFFFLSFLVVIPTIPFQFLAVEIAGNEHAGPEGTDNLFSVLIVAPIVETLIFQHLAFNILGRVIKGRNSDLLIIVISSTLFALVHAIASSILFSHFQKEYF
jgi:hypothetical protein